MVSLRASLSLSAIVAAGVVFLPSVIEGDGPSRYADALLRSVPLFVLWFLVLAGPTRFSATAPAGLVRQPWLVALPWAVLGLASTPYGMRQFGGYDLGLLVDAGWRLHLGQIPGSDFPSTLPPGFLALARLAMVGESWRGMVLMGLLHSLIAGALLLAALVRLRRTDIGSVALTTAAIVGPFVLTTHLWHSLVASQAGAVAIVLALVFRERALRCDGIIVGFAIAWALCQKPNVGLPSAFVALLLVGTSSSARRSLPVLLLALVGGVVVVLGVARVNPLDLVPTYRALAAARAGLTFWLPDALPPVAWWGTVLGYVLPAVTVVVAWLRASWRDDLLSASTWAGVTGVVAAAVGLSSNWDLKSNDWPLLGVSVVLLLPIETSPVVRLQQRLRLLTTVGTAVALTWFCTATGAGRLRQNLVGYGSFFEFAPTRQVNGRYLDGLHASPRLQRVLQEVEVVLQAVPPDAPVFFGPRMEALYAHTGRTSPRGLPVWWHPGSSFTEAQWPAIFDAAQRTRFAVAIFLHNDFTRVPRPLMEHFRLHYVVDRSSPALTVLWPR